MSATREHRRGAFLGLALLASAPLAALALDEETVSGVGHGQSDEVDCLRCHASVQEVLEREVTHFPAAEGACTACHAPHAARFEHLLHKRERALCFSCHRTEKLAFQTGSVHTPIREGQCTACHEVHGSEHESLLVTSGNELCFGCHDQKQKQMGFATTHEPFADGECVDCHQPHNSAHENQLVAPANSLCLLCHDVDDADLIEAHYGIPPGGSQCTSCHEPHAAAGSALLKSYTHPPFESGECDLCHAVESDTPRLLRATGGGLCRVCHPGIPGPDAVIHKPVEEGNCRACHSAHASNEERLLEQGPRAVCVQCHADVQRRFETARSAHPARVEGGSCLICHRPHSSPDEHLLAAGPIRTCLACHADQQHGHPIGGDRLDPRTGKPVNCLSCHNPHGTEFPYMLRGDLSRGLCIECHTIGR